MKIRIQQNASGTSYWLFCPGCTEAHRITDLWQFNGNPDKPTFTPSILVNGGEAPRLGSRCHSFLTDGVWHFLSDCDHSLAGQDVPMVDLPDWLAEEV